VGNTFFGGGRGRRNSGQFLLQAVIGPLKREKEERPRAGGLFVAEGGGGKRESWPRRWSLEGERKRRDRLLTKAARSIESTSPSSTESSRPRAGEGGEGKPDECPLTSCPRTGKERGGKPKHTNHCFPPTGRKDPLLQTGKRGKQSHRAPTLANPVGRQQKTGPSLCRSTPT